MQTIINLYNLKTNSNVEDFKKWSKEVDQKMVPKQKGVYSFEVIEIKGNEKGSEYQFAEIIKVDSYKTWQEILQKDEMREVQKQWNNLGDEFTVVTWYGDVF